jgi:hypothetical protein
MDGWMGLRTRPRALELNDVVGLGRRPRGTGRPDGRANEWRERGSHGEIDGEAQRQRHAPRCPIYLAICIHESQILPDALLHAAVLQHFPRAAPVPLPGRWPFIVFYLGLGAFFLSFFLFFSFLGRARRFQMRRSIEALRLFFIRRRYYTVHVRVRCRRVMRTGKQSNAPSHAGRRAPCPGPASTSPSTTRPLGAVGRSRSSRACGQVLGSHRFKGKLVGGAPRSISSPCPWSGLAQLDRCNCKW